MNNPYEKERWDMARVMAQNFHINGEGFDESDFEWTAHCLQMEGYRKQEWISVNERLPEREGKYLGYTIKGTIAICNYWSYFITKEGDLSEPQFDYWVTHWMPLPEPPKGE